MELAPTLNMCKRIVDLVSTDKHLKSMVLKEEKQYENSIQINC